MAAGMEQRHHTTVIKFLSNPPTNIKVRLYLHCEMLIADNDIKEAEFRSGSEIILKGGVNNLEELYDNAKERMVEEMHNYISMGSGWVLHTVAKLVIHTAEYKPLGGSSYVELPQFIKDKKEVINMQNKDNKCFMDCIVRALNPVKTHPERVNKLLRTQAQQLHWDGIEFPFKLNDIDKFEKMNNNLAINVFIIEGKDISPLKISKAPQRRPDVTYKYINLLLYKGHYSLINNFSRLVRSQITNDKGASLFCYRCLCAFSCESSLDKREDLCKNQWTILMLREYYYLVLHYMILI
jgi:hypothetical protein